MFFTFIFILWFHFLKKILHKKPFNFHPLFYMGRTGLFDLEKHFAFYGSYHRNPINIAIHVLFVWPIFFTALIFLYFTPPFFDIPNFEFLLFGCNFVLVWNLGFLVTLVYSVFYASLDLKAGSLAAFCCVVCWAGSCFVAHQLGWSLSWKVNNVVPFWMHFLFSSDTNVCFSYVRGSNMFSCSCLYCIFVIVWFDRIPVALASIGLPASWLWDWYPDWTFFGWMPSFQQKKLSDLTIK